MGSKRLHIRRLRSGGIITNYNCAAACGHCLYRSGPHRSADYMNTRTLADVIDVLQRLGCDSVHIGGGEPFTQPARLALVLEAARERGLNIEYVETNSQWFTDIHEATDLLRHLGRIGLGRLLVSVSPFHNSTVPLAKVNGVIAACRRAGLTPFVWIPEFLEEVGALDPTRTHRIAEFEKHFGDGYLRTIPGRYWVHFGGRALATFGRVFDRYDHQAILERSAGGCVELTRTDHFHVDLYGNYIPGLCAGLAIRMQHLRAPLDSRKYPLLNTLYEEGIQGLFGLAVEQHGFEPRERGYLSKCDLCDHIRRHLVRDCGLESPELAPREFFETNTRKPA